jgi:hypothetical protein
MIGKNVNVSKISISTEGRVVLSDDDLTNLVATTLVISAGGEQTNGDSAHCNGFNEACTNNNGACGNSTNHGGCHNNGDASIPP